MSWDQDQKMRIRRFPPCPGDNYLFVWMGRYSKAIRPAVDRVIREPVKSDSSHLEAATIRYTLLRTTQIDEPLALNIASRPDHRHIFESSSQKCLDRKSCAIRLVTDTSIDNMNGDLRVVALPVELWPDLCLRNK